MFKLAIVLMLTMQSGDVRTQRIQVENYTFRSETGCYLSGMSTLNQLFPMRGYRYIPALEVNIKCEETQ